MCFDRKDCQERTQERGSEARIPQGPSLIPRAFMPPKLACEYSCLSFLLATLR